MIDWTTDKDALLGTMSDAQAAKRLGVSASSVINRRHALGINAHAPKSGVCGAQEAYKATHHIKFRTRDKLAEIRPLLLAKFVADGIPIRTLANWQIVEYAINQLHADLTQPKESP